MKNSYYCIYCTDMLKTEQRQSKLFEFSQNSQREEFKIKKMVSLCNGFVTFVAMAFVSSVCLCLQTKLSSMLTTVYTGEHRPVVKDF